MGKTYESAMNAQLGNAQEANTNTNGNPNEGAGKVHHFEQYTILSHRTANLLNALNLLDNAYNVITENLISADDGNFALAENSEEMKKGCEGCEDKILSSICEGIIPLRRYIIYSASLNLNFNKV